MDTELVIEEYHKALDMFSRGDPDPAKALFSQADDVMLANLFGSIAKGWKLVSEALDFASSRFRDGELEGTERIVGYKANDLLIIFEIEKWRSKVGGSLEISSFDLRVSSTFRIGKRRLETGTSSRRSHFKF